MSSSRVFIERISGTQHAFLPIYVLKEANVMIAGEVSELIDSMQVKKRAWAALYHRL